MTDPKQVRINDSQDPDRADKFDQLIKRTALSGNAVIRELVDALIRYEAKHGHAPPFPVEIVPIEGARKRRR